MQNLILHPDHGERIMDRRKTLTTIAKDDFYLESLRSSTEVIAMSSDWLTLAYLEPLWQKSMVQESMVEKKQ